MTSVNAQAAWVTQFEGKRVEYANEAEIANALADLETRIRRASAPRPGSINFSTSKRYVMANRPALLKQSELTRYLKAMKAAGNEGGRVEVKPDGTHVIFTGDTDPASGANPCDRLLK